MGFMQLDRERHVLHVKRMSEFSNFCTPVRFVCVSDHLINCLLDTERLARSKLSRTNDEAPPEPTTPGSLAQLLHMLGIL